MIYSVFLFTGKAGSLRARVVVSSCGLGRTALKRGFCTRAGGQLSQPSQPPGGCPWLLVAHGCDNRCLGRISRL